jgi:hypothetical protein
VHTPDTEATRDTLAGARGSVARASAPTTSAPSFDISTARWSPKTAGILSRVDR